jgi:hypothetical protein
LRRLRPRFVLVVEEPEPKVVDVLLDVLPVDVLV